MDYKIVLDSCGELTYKMKESGIYHTAVLSMLVDGDTILDDTTFDREDFLKRVAVSPECPKSSCPSPDAYMELYNGEEKRVYAVTLSAELSGSYNSAQLGKELWKEENEGAEKQIYVFNSRSASVGETLIARKIQECEERGESFEEVIEHVEAYIEEQHTYFLLETLDILKKNHVKATFFVTGKEDASSKKIYQRIVKEGHTLAMHSYSHIQDVIYDSKEAFEKDLKQINRCLYEATGVHTKFYRFPGGSSTQNTSLPIQNFIDVLKKNHYLYLDWNVISPDINNANATKEQVVTGVMQGVDAYDTAVVLMYDVADKPMTVKALPSIIKQIKAKNYELLPVDESMILIQHNNGNQEEGK